MRIKERDITIPSNSMADIAFLLLVFFLLTTTINQEKALFVVLPDETLPVSPNNIEVIYINSFSVLYEDNEIDIEQIRKRAETSELLNPNMIFQIQTSRNVDFKTYIHVLDQLKQANVKKISTVIK